MKKKIYICRNKSQMKKLILILISFLVLTSCVKYSEPKLLSLSGEYRIDKITYENRDDNSLNQVFYPGDLYVNQSETKPLDCGKQHTQDLTNMLKGNLSNIDIYNLLNEEEYQNARMALILETNAAIFESDKKRIEDKKLLLACSSDKFEKIDDDQEYELYHFSLESINLAVKMPIPNKRKQPVGLIILV